MSTAAVAVPRHRAAPLAGGGSSGGGDALAALRRAAPTAVSRLPFAPCVSTQRRRLPLAAAARCNGPLQPHHQQPQPRRPLHRRPAAAIGPQPPPFDPASNNDEDDPDIDDLVLDEAYYAQYGMTKDAALREQLLSNYEDDPDALPADASDIRVFQEAAAGASDMRARGLTEAQRQRIEALETYGPEVGC
jgi:hypothetical protein